MNRLLTFFLTALLAFTVGWAAEVTFQIGTDSGTAGTSATMTKDGITITTNGTFSRTDNYRSYANSTTTFSSSVGNIISIEITCTTEAYNTFSLVSGSSGTYTKDGAIGTWIGDANSVSLSASSQARYTKVVVTTVSAYVAPPTISPDGGNFATSQEVTLSHADADAIYYTLDGSDPTTTSTQYTAPFTITSTKTVKAIAVKGSNVSSTASATFTNIGVGTIAEAYDLNQGLVFIFTGNAVVTYQNGRYVWIRDNSGSGLIYRKSGETSALNNGDILNTGWSATNTTFSSSIPEFTNPTGVATSSNGGAVAPFDKTSTGITAANVNEYVSFSHVTLSWDTSLGYCYVTIGNNRVYFRNDFYNYVSTGLTVTSGNTYDIEGIAYVQNNNTFVYMTKVTPISPVLSINPTSLTINDSGTDNTLTITGENINGNINAALATNTDWYLNPNTFSNTGGTASVTYNGRALSSSNTVNVTANGATDVSATVNYVADLYVVTDNGVTGDWHFDGTYGEHMTNNNGIYTATFTASADNTYILFARKLGNGVNWNTRYVFGPNSSGDWWLPTSGNGNGNIDLNDDDPIKIQTAGTYIITINANAGTFTIEKEVVNEGDFVLVTDATQLNFGDEIIFVNSGTAGDDEAQAMSTTQSTNNRPATAVTVSNYKKVTATDETQIFTLEGSSAGWYFKTVNGNTQGYIYASSSSANQLKTEATADNNAKATISVANDGQATVVFQGSNTRNNLRYNRNNGSPIFACYASTSNQSLPYIYRREASSDEPSITVNPSTIDIVIPAGSTSEQGTATVTESNTTGTTSVSVTGDDVNNFTASLNNGTLTVTYNGTAPQDNPDVVTVTLTNGTASASVAVTGYKIPLTVTFDPASGTTFTGTSMDGTLSANAADATIYYSLDGGQTWQEYTDGFTVTVATVGQSATVQAYAVFNDETSATVSATYTRVDQSATLYEKVTKVEQIQDGQQYILVYEDTPEAMDGITTGGTSETVTWYAQGKIVDIAGTDVIPFILGGNADELTLSCASGYLAPKAPGLEFTADAVNWSADSIEGGYVLKWGNYMMRYNNGASSANGRFRIYNSSTGVPVYLYVKMSNLSTSLAFIESFVTKNSQVTVNDELIGVWAVVNPDKGINKLWAKDQGNASIDKTFKTDEQTDYVKDIWGLETKDEWDQSNWVVLDFGALTGESAFNYVSRKLESATVKGYYTDDLNYTIQLTEAPTKVDENDVIGYPGYNCDYKETSSGVVYYYNHYTPANFMTENLNEPYGDGAEAGPASSVEGMKLFFMNPKVQEIAQVWAVWMGNDRFDVIAKGTDANGNSVNGYDLSGAFDVLTWDYNRLGGPDENPDYGSPLADNANALDYGTPYLFHVIVTRNNYDYGHQRRAPGATPSGAFGIMPADLPAGHPDPTVVKDVNGVKQVESVCYYNIMGMESMNPFEGVNIVVTRFSDGSISTFKVIR